MLRITRTQKDGKLWLRLEGKLVGPWVDEFRSTIAREATPTDRIKLDLSEITFVDAQGLRFLRELADNGHDVQKRSRFLAELMRAETSS